MGHLKDPCPYDLRWKTIEKLEMRVHEVDVSIDFASLMSLRISTIYIHTVQGTHFHDHRCMQLLQIEFLIDNRANIKQKAKKRNYSIRNLPMGHVVLFFPTSIVCILIADAEVPHLQPPRRYSTHHIRIEERLRKVTAKT